MNNDRSYDREKQLSVARALLAMLIAADKADVPPVRWTVNVSGWSLYGEIDTPVDPNPHATYGAWVNFLGLQIGRNPNWAFGTCPANPQAVLFDFARSPVATDPNVARARALMEEVPRYVLSSISAGEGRFAEGIKCAPAGFEAAAPALVEGHGNTTLQGADLWTPIGVFMPYQCR